MAGPHTTISFTCTYPYDKSGTTAERWDPSIRDDNRKVIYILDSPTKSSPSGQNAGCIIYRSKDEIKVVLTC